MSTVSFIIAKQLSNIFATAHKKIGSNILLVHHEVRLENVVIHLAEILTLHCNNKRVEALTT